MNRAPAGLKAAPVLALLLTIGVFLPWPARAATCDGTKSLAHCATRLLADRVDPEVKAQQSPVRKAAVADGAREQSVAPPTGADTADASRTGTKNFQPLASVLALLGRDTRSDDQGNLVVDLNFLLPGTGKDHNTQLQAIVATDPQVSKDVLATLPESRRADDTKSLQESVGDLDDVTISLSYSPTRLGWGRGFRDYAATFDALYESSAATAGAVSPNLSQLTDELETIADDCAGLKSRLEQESSEWISDLSLDEIAQLALTFERAELARLGTPLPAGEVASPNRCPDGSAIVKRMERTIFERAARDAADVADLRARLARHGLDRFGALVANQPQLVLSVVRRERADLVGADETSVKLAYEWSDANLNTVLSRSCATVLAEGKSDGDCLARYAEGVETLGSAIDRGRRFSIGGEYQEVGKRQVSLAALDRASLTFPGSHKLIASVSYSTFLRAAGGVEPVRFDLVGRYEDVSGDPTRRDRGVVTATFTRKVAGIEVPLGIVYANHGEYLGEVDERLSVHLGLKLGLDPGK